MSGNFLRPKNNCYGNCCSGKVIRNCLRTNYDWVSRYDCGIHHYCETDYAVGKKTTGCANFLGYR